MWLGITFIHRGFGVLLFCVAAAAEEEEEDV